jgi:hypothetical protein
LIYRNTTYVDAVNLPTHNVLFNTDKTLPAAEVDFPIEGEGILAYVGARTDLPLPVFGTRDELGWGKHVCFERDGRFDIYKSKDVHWGAVDWGKTQEVCAAANSHRWWRGLEPGEHRPGERGKHAMGWIDKGDGALYKRLLGWGAKSTAPEKEQVPFSESALVRQTAIVLRANWDTKYTEDDIRMVTSLITETALHTGGAYRVFLLVRVDSSIIHPTDTETSLLQRFVPPVFHSIASTWSLPVLRAWYPKLPSSGNSSGNPAADELPFDSLAQYLPLQRFAHRRPSYGTIINVPLTRLRFTGHWHDLFSSLTAFAQKQPRKLQWERNERLYIPSIHGSYKRGFRSLTETAIGGQDEAIWRIPDIPGMGEWGLLGAEPTKPKPSDENYVWGVGEPADLITVSPVFDPRNSTYEYRRGIFGFDTSDHRPRRASRGEFVVVSRRLLEAMHEQALAGRFMVDGLSPATVALGHGLKVVVAPVPAWSAGDWEGGELEKFWLGGRQKSVGGDLRSCMGMDRGEWWGGMSVALGWDGRSFNGEGLASKVYRTWIGRGRGDAETKTLREREEKDGRMCLPPMLLYPVEDTTSEVLWGPLEVGKGGMQRSGVPPRPAE